METNPFDTLATKLDRIEDLLLSSNTGKSETSETLNLNQAAKICQISVSRMYDLSRRNEIPNTRIGSRYVFVKSDLIKWLRNRSS